MKIAFLSINREILPDPVVPLGLLYLISNTPDKYKKELWDLCFEDDPLAYLQQKVASFGPDIIAVGIRNIQNNDYTDSSANLEYYDRVFRQIRKLSDSPIVVGGSAFSVLPEEFMNRYKPDFGIWGEGESSFSFLVEAIASSDLPPLAGIKNLYFHRDGKLVVNPRSSVPIDLNEINHPDYSYADPRYYQTGGAVGLQTKRGCPLQCTYCTYPVIEGRSKRVRHPSAVADEMVEMAQDPRIEHLFIVDSVFNLPPSHAKNLCHELIKRNFSTPWTCYINPLGFDRELAKLMRDAACVGFECGSDSGCDDVLKSLKKGFSTSKIRELSKISKEIGLKDCHTFILGTEGEDEGHVNRTLDFITELDPFCAILMVWVDDYSLMDPEQAQKRSLFAQRITSLLNEKKEHNPRWVIPALKTNFGERFFRVLRRMGLRGPLWQFIDRQSPAIPSKGRGIMNLR